VRIDKVVTEGVFSLDGEDFDVEDNIWIIGDDERCIVIDAAHDADAIVDGVDGRAVDLIFLTHAHNDHINAALELKSSVQAPIALHPDDHELWHHVYEDVEPDRWVADGDEVAVAGETLRVIHTPGHSPGGVCLYTEGHVFVGDTLFQGGPGATGRSFSDFDTIIGSIRGRLLTLPPDTVVHPGHGDDTTIGAESPHLQEWIERGH
jgi:glyoxylase-like metal-dependent hydrolase (beta-lactamase superfamily II)